MPSGQCMSGSTDEREYKRSEGGARGFFILVLKLTGTELSTVRTSRNHHGRQYACGVICSTGRIFSRWEPDLFPRRKAVLRFTVPRRHRGEGGPHSHPSGRATTRVR